MKYKKTYKLFNVLLLLVSFSSINAQLQDNFNTYNISESVKITTDRDIYICGDILYFTADYFINNEKIAPVLSTVLYVELVNCADNSVVLQKKYKISDYKSSGAFNIPKDLSSGNYVLLAYTQYQRNFSSMNYSYQFIAVLNPHNNPIPTTNFPELEPIKIVPESNILLDNVINRVVFMIPEAFLNEKNKYLITDQNFNIIKELKSINYGFAQEEMTFFASKRYKLLIIKAGGDSISKDFPVILNSGIQTSTRITKETVQYKIHTKGLNNSNMNLKYQVSLFSHDFTIKNKKEIDLIDSVNHVFLSKNLFDEGINYIVLTDPKGNTVKINSVFIPLYQQFEIDIKTDKDIFNIREKINTQISLKESNAKELPVLSVSVIKHGTNKNDHNFIPSFYLNNPILLSDYLNQNTEYNDLLQSQIMILLDEKLDLNAFQENHIKSVVSSPIFIPEFRDLTISGILRNKLTKEPIKGRNVYVSVLFNNPQLHICKTKDNGEFIFSINNSVGINDIFLCSEIIAGDTVEHEILINSPFSNDLQILGSFPTFINTKDKELIEELYINSQIQQKYYANPSIESHQRNKTNTFNLNDNMTSTIIDNFIKLKSMEELFIEIVPNVRFRKIKDQYSFNVFDDRGNSLTGNPLILIDKVPIFDPNKIMQLDVSKIRQVDVIYNTYFLGSHVFNGVIMLSSNTDNFAGIKFPQSSTFLEFQSLENPNNFLGNFKNCSKLSEKMPDFRTTLYWNPNLKLTKSEQEINFCASDRKGTYDIIVKGYSQSGQLFYGKKQITVK